MYTTRIIWNLRQHASHNCTQYQILAHIRQSPMILVAQKLTHALSFTVSVRLETD